MKASNRTSGTKRHARAGPDRADRLGRVQPRRQIGAPTNGRHALNDRTRKSARRKRSPLRDEVAGHDDQQLARTKPMKRTWLQILEEQPLKSALIGLSLLTAVSVGLVLGRYWMRR